LFGPQVTFLVIGLLATLSVGALAYALLFNRVSGTAERDRRLNEVKARKVEAAGAVRSDPAARRKTVQETLKEMEERQKASAKLATSPPLALRLQQAGLSWTKRGFVVGSVVAGLVVGLLSLVFGAPAWAALSFALAAGLGLPRWVVNFIRKRRFKKFVEEFPNAVDVVVRGVKAGLPLNDCLRIIMRESAEPVRSEFRVINEAQALGLNMADAVAKLPERMPLAESKFFSIVIAIQAQAGGNLTEALGNLSRVLRERKKMKGKITAMSMEAKASAWIIGALPVIVMFLVYLSSPNYISLLFTEPLGNVILGASAFWMLCGVMVMRKMINFDY
jgi:tight adherence protein B